jgi:hypothetical protein
MYFITTRSPSETVEGKMPMSAKDALRFHDRAAGTILRIEVRDGTGKLVPIDQLRRDAASESQLPGV